MDERVIDDGGPAFAREYSYNTAIPGSNRPEHAQRGMTLRQKYAERAMGGMIANHALWEEMENSVGDSDDGETIWERISMYAFAQADAMIAEERKEKFNG